MCIYNECCSNDNPHTGCYTFEKWSELMNSKYKNWIPITESYKESLIKNFEYQHYLKKLKKKTIPKIVWLTIRPKNCKETDFKIFVTKILSWKCIEKYYVAYEWKHTDESSGLHAHIILKGENKRILENLRKKSENSKVTTFKKIGKTMFFWKLISATMLQDKIDYCNGKTWEDEKNEHKKSDPFYRKKYNMPNINTFKLKSD